MVDKLDPSQSFNAQLRRAGRTLDGEDASDFKNIQDSLIKAKKQKQVSNREAQKQMAVLKQNQEAELLSER